MIAIVYIIAKMSSIRDLERLHKWEKRQEVPEIWVEISGHVLRPGKYKMNSNDSLGSVIRKAKPKSFADLSNIDCSAAVFENRSIEIHPYETIRIRVAGCVREILDLEVTPGFRICDLKGKVDLTPDADRTFLRKRRVLQNGEVVEIPPILKSL